ncbi:MAG: GNAT family N-acetyltransferase [Microbacterium sp. SCN 70-18]|nr:GNAT family N-acetyltransferase [Microbacterium chocolatum]ODT11814.1 MAG: GNAT family N-acetyltransferase [Microbacterium sp. SCN 70-18]
MTTLTITPARAEDLDAAAAVLAEAFAEDPALRAVVADGPGRSTRLTRLFRATLAAGPFPTGTVDLARDASGRILGVAAWEGPTARRGGIRRYLGQLPALLRALGPAGLVRAARVSSIFDARRPLEPHWYLAEIGVAPEARGLGVGGRLLATHLAALDRMRQAAYLESSTPINRRLYARLGFVELDAIDGLDGARPMAMLRPPQVV